VDLNGSCRDGPLENIGARHIQTSDPRRFNVDTVSKRHTMQEAETFCGNRSGRLTPLVSRLQDSSLAQVERQTSEKERVNTGARSARASRYHPRRVRHLAELGPQKRDPLLEHIRDVWTRRYIETNCTAAIWRNDFGLELRVERGGELIESRLGTAKHRCCSSLINSRRHARRRCIQDLRDRAPHRS
jgi:hypothetical protein